MPPSSVTGCATFKQRIGRVVVPRLPITQFLFTILRTECRCATVWLGNAVLPSRRRRLTELRGQRNLLVNVAAGPQVLEGFVNLDLYPASPDVIAWDSARRSLPLADGSASGIRVEHFVEHLEPREELPAFLQDCRRALKSGGMLRVIVPDAERYLRAYCRIDRSGFRELGVPEPFPEDLPTRMDVVNHIFHQWHEHRWGYDFETLEDRLSRAGFRSIDRRMFRQSGLAALAQDRDVHAPYSLYVEAIR